MFQFRFAVFILLVFIAARGMSLPPEPQCEHCNSHLERTPPQGDWHCRQCQPEVFSGLEGADSGHSWELSLFPSFRRQEITPDSGTISAEPPQNQAEPEPRDSGIVHAGDEQREVGERIRDSERAIHIGITVAHERLDRTEEKSKALSDRLDKLDKNVASLWKSLNEIKQGVKAISHEVHGFWREEHWFRDEALTASITEIANNNGFSETRETDAIGRVHEELRDLMIDIGDHSLGRRRGGRSHQPSLSSMEAINNYFELTNDRARAILNHVRQGNQVRLILFDRQRMPFMAGRLLLGPGLISIDSNAAAAAEREMLLILQGQPPFVVNADNLQSFINKILDLLKSVNGRQERIHQERLSRMGIRGSSAPPTPGEREQQIFPCEIRFDYAYEGSNLGKAPEEPED